MSEAVITGLSKEEEASVNQAVLNANNTEKQRKDKLLMNVAELENHERYMHNRIAELDLEYRSRKRLVDGINGGIAGAQAELSDVRNRIVKEKELILREISEQREEVDKADKTLRALISQNESLLVSNRQKESELIEHRRNCDNQLYEMRKALAENQSQWDKREKDILKREQELSEEKAKFEVEKASILPEMARISAIKNESINLAKEVELQRQNNANILMGIESERQLFEEAKLVQANKDKVWADKLANEEKRLREWEQGLKDFDLEIRAKSARADKMIKEFQLKKEIASGEAN